LIIVLAVAGFFYHADSSFAYIQQLVAFVGRDACRTLAGTLVAVHTSEHGFAAGWVSAIVLFIGGTGVFIQLQSSMNQIWGTELKPGRFWKHFLKERLLSLVMIAGRGFLLLIALVWSACCRLAPTCFQALCGLSEIADGGVRVQLSLCFSRRFSKSSLTPASTGTMYGPERSSQPFFSLQDGSGGSEEIKSSDA
jgi:uncharacterized BrkB/YihY/UPF0761 family membrane protein